jgi:hypothetical protein
MIFKIEAMILEHGKPVNQTVTLEKRVTFLPSKGMLLNCHQLASAVIGLVYTLDGNTFVAQLENVLQPTSGDTLKYMLDNGWEYKDLSLLNSTPNPERSATQQQPNQGDQPDTQSLAAEVERLKGEGEAPKWIPVSERLPEEIERRYSVRVLCCTDSGYITQGYLMNGDWMYDARSVKFKDYGYIVTHWMPLPPKPSSNA